MAFVELRDISKRFGPRQAVEHASLSIDEGEFVSLLGPSGCGKTTLLRAVTGLTPPDEGRVTLAGREVFDAATRVDVPTEKRELGMVFQSYALWPHMRVADNIGYPLRVRRRPRAEVWERVRELMEVVDLADETAGRFPYELSGGQQQRVALCRALAARPKLLLMDEPLSNLDTKLRERVRFEIKNIQRSTGVTILYVTHDQEEALSMSDRIGVMRDGRVVQLGRPEEVYARPANAFVADFVGDGNVLPAVVEEGGLVRFEEAESMGALRFELPDGASPGSRVFVVVRPEDVAVAAATERPEVGLLEVRLRQLLYRGRDREALLTCGSLKLRALLPADFAWHADQAILVRLRRAHVMIR